jgi:hypothetical protein
MNLHKTVVVLLALLLVAMAMVPMVSADSPGKVQVDKTPVTLDYATKVAQLHLTEMAAGLPTFTEWTGATAEYDMTFYDTDGAINAYSFSVTKDGKKQGFILVSGIKEEYPILEFGKGDIIPENAKENANRMAINVAEKKSGNVDSVKYLYLGPTFYYAQYALTDSMQKSEDDVTIDLFNQNEVDLKDDRVSIASMRADSESDVISIKKAWSSIDETINLFNQGIAVPASTLGIDTIYGVPLYDQPSGYPNSCAPTASGMILSYWRSHDYPNFPSNGDTLILELYSAMNTDPVYGTDDADVKPGIESVSQDHGYSIDAVEDTDPFLFSEVKSEVTADRPIHLIMHGASPALGQTTPYGHHSVAVVGWADGAFDALEINDGWSTSVSRYIVFNNWTYTNPVYIQP